MVKGTSLVNSFGGQINVAPVNGGAHFAVEFTGLPAEACTKMATMDLGTGLYEIEVSGASTVSEQGKPLGPAQANAACGASNNASIVWTFF